MGRLAWNLISVAAMMWSMESAAGAVLRPPAGEAAKLPPGINVVDWAQIKAEYQRHRHAFFPATEGGKQVHVARAWEQQWLATFDGRGFTVKPKEGNFAWGLELESYGREGREIPVGAGQTTAKVTAKVNRFSYHYGPALTEWFVNGTQGLEHGFTLRERPAGAGAMVLTLAVRGGLRPHVSGDQVAFVDEASTPRMRYSALTVVDARGRRVPARFEVFPDHLRIAVDDSAAQYPLTVDPLAQQAYVKASNTGLSDNFGWSVAASGDTVVVGAQNEDSSTTGVNSTPNEGASDSGAAYVFVRSGSTWSQQAYLKASNPGASDFFGYSVAASGDTVVVGAYLEDSSTTGVNSTPNEGAVDSGAAYVFVRSGSTWSQQAYLKASSTGAGDLFGISVAASGDTVVVGAYGEDSSTTGVNSTPNEGAGASGAAYVLVRSGSTWSQQAYLKASNTGASDLFGWSVAASGDTVVVGAYGEDSSTTGVNSTPNEGAGASGAAYVFVRSGGTWSQQAYLKASNTGASDQFGYSVAASGDTVVVGAYGEDSSASGVNSTPNNSAGGSGAAYVFVRSGSTWSQQAYLKASNTGANDFFGLSVAASGDTVVVGAYLEDSSTTGVNSTPNDSATASGAAYVFVRSGSTWSQQDYLKASNTGANDFFGWSVAASGDTVVVGARLEDSSTTGVNSTPNDSATDSGAAYIFVPDTLNLTVNSTPSSLLFSASGLGCPGGSGLTTPTVLPGTPAQSCNLTFGTPQLGAPGTRYVFGQWEDASTNPARTFTVPATSTTYTATFQTQHLLTTAVSPAGAGTVAAAPSSGDGYYAAGTVVTLTPTGQCFAGFSPASPVTLSAPQTVTATFNPTVQPVTITPGPLQFIRTLNRWRQLVTITTATPLTNPRLVLTSLSAGIGLASPAAQGTSTCILPAGSPYVPLTFSGNTAPGDAGVHAAHAHHASDLHAEGDRWHQRPLS